MKRRLALLLLCATAPGLLYLLVEAGIIWPVSPDRDRYPVMGIDVSHHQGPIDWSRLAGSEVRFAWIKATEGGDWRDTRFAENWAGARSAGIVPGAYHFFTFCRPVADQIANLLAVLPAEADALPVAIDLEFGGNCAARPAPATLRTDIWAFSDAVLAHTGRRPLLYLTRDFADGYVDAPLAAAHELWVRDIFRVPAPVQGRDWTIWQHKSRGRLPGVVGPVDLNVFHAPEERWASWIKAR